MSAHLVTLHLNAGGEGSYHLGADAVGCYGGDHWLKPGAHIVKVEPAPRELPTEIGSLILARIKGVTAPVTLEFRRVTGAPGRTGWLCPAVGYFEIADILGGWVQIDPETLRPVEDPA